MSDVLGSNAVSDEERQRLLALTDNAVKVMTPFDRRFSLVFGALLHSMTGNADSGLPVEFKADLGSAVDGGSPLAIGWLLAYSPETLSRGERATLCGKLAASGFAQYAKPCLGTGFASQSSNNANHAFLDDYTDLVRQAYSASFADYKAVACANLVEKYDPAAVCADILSIAHLYCAL